MKHTGKLAWKPRHPDDWRQLPEEQWPADRRPHRMAVAIFDDFVGRRNLETLPVEFFGLVPTYLRMLFPTHPRGVPASAHAELRAAVRSMEAAREDLAVPREDIFYGIGIYGEEGRVCAVMVAARRASAWEAARAVLQRGNQCR